MSRPSVAWPTQWRHAAHVTEDVDPLGTTRKALSTHATCCDGGLVTAHLLIGPLLRRIVGDRATIWVETTEPTVVRVEADGGGAGSAGTFPAYGHHYALVVVEGLVPDAANAYRVFLDDRPVWPQSESPYPPSVIRTR